MFYEEWRVALLLFYFLWEGVRVRFIVSVLKTDVQKCTVGSNPTLPVINLQTLQKESEVD